MKRVPVDEPTHTQRILAYGCWHCDTIREKQKGSLEGSPETLRPVRCSLRTTRSVRIHTFDRGSYSSKCVLRFYATLLRRSLRFGIRLSQETESCSCKVCDTEKHICIVGNCLCGFRLILLACRLGWLWFVDWDLKIAPTRLPRPRKCFRTTTHRLETWGEGGMEDHGRMYCVC